VAAPGRGTGAKIQTALERAGVEFIEENGGGPGVRLRKSQRGADHIDIAAINGLNSDNQAVNFNLLASTPTSIAAHTIDILTSGGNTVIYANASGTAQNISSSDMEIHLMNVANVTSADFIIHH